MNLVLVNAGELDVSGRVVLEGRRFLHVRQVLGVSPGSRIRVGVLGGGRHVGEVEAVNDASCVVRLQGALAALPVPTVDLLLALPRPKCLQRLLPQLAAVGIGRLYLVHASKVQRDYWGSQVIKNGDFPALLAEGLEQAGDVHVPDVVLSRSIKRLIQDELPGVYPRGCRWVAHPCDPGEARDGLRSIPPEARVLLAVGPEGGWTEEELGLFKDNGFFAFGLGPRVLRTDTACVALLSVLNWIRSGG